MKVILRWLLVAILVIPIYGIYRSINKLSSSDGGLTVEYITGETPGFYITGVQSGGAADNVGLQVGDRLALVEGQKPEASDQLWAEGLFGDTLDLTVERAGEFWEFHIPTAYPDPLAFLPEVVFPIIAILLLIAGLIAFCVVADNTIATIFYLFCISSATSLSPLPLELKLPGVISLTESLYLPLPYSAGIFTAMLFLLLALYFPRKKQWVEKAVWLPAVVVMFCSGWAVLVATFSYIQVTHAADLSYLHLPPSFFDYPIRLLIMIAGLVALVHSYFTLRNPALRRRLSYIIWGSIFGIAPLEAANIITLLNNYFDLSYLLNHQHLFLYPLILVPLSFGFVILRQRVWNLLGFLSRALVFGLSIAIALAIAITIAWLLALYLPDWVNWQHNLTIIAVTALIFGLGFMPLSRALLYLEDRFIRRENFQLKRQLSELASELPHFRRPERFLQILTNRLEKTYGAVKSYLYCAGEEKVHSSGRTNEVYFPNDGGLAGWFKTEPRSINVREDGEELEERLTREELKVLSDLEAELLVPMEIGDELIGWIMLTSRENGKNYSPEETKELHIFSSAIACQIARVLCTDIANKESKGSKKMSKEIGELRNLPRKKSRK